MTIAKAEEWERDASSANPEEKSASTAPTIMTMLTTRMWPGFKNMLPIPVKSFQGVPQACAQNTRGDSARQ